MYLKGVSLIEPVQAVCMQTEIKTTKYSVQALYKPTEIKIPQIKSPGGPGSGKG